MAAGHSTRASIPRTRASSRAAYFVPIAGIGTDAHVLQHPVVEDRQRFTGAGGEEQDQPEIGARLDAVLLLRAGPAVLDLGEDVGLHADRVVPRRRRPALHRPPLVDAVAFADGDAQVDPGPAHLPAGGEVAVGLLQDGHHVGHAQHARPSPRCRSAAWVDPQHGISRSMVRPIQAIAPSREFSAPGRRRSSARSPAAGSPTSPRRSCRSSRPAPSARPGTRACSRCRPGSAWPSR